MTDTPQITPFGKTADGREVQAIHLRRAGIEATILTLGAFLQDLRLAGVGHGLTLGSDRVSDYEGQMQYHGSLMAPVAGRLSGASAPIDGKEFHFEANQDGKTTLHSGSTGGHRQNWALGEVSATSVALTLDLPDGLGGFPGNRHLSARFSLPDDATLRLEIEATTDAPTLINITNHSYWNLDGTEDLSGHTFQSIGDAYIPLTADLRPMGEVRPVEGTPYDFRQPRRLGPSAPKLDLCYALSQQDMPLRDVAWLKGASGNTLTLATTAPGLQIYDAAEAIRPGHDYGEGFALEAQGWPDAPNHPEFPSIEVKPGQVWRHCTEWRFSRG